MHLPFLPSASFVWAISNDWLTMIGYRNTMTNSTTS